MFVDIWILSIFSVLFGICAVWNYNKGKRIGTAETIVSLAMDKIIKITANGEIVSYDNPKNISKNVGIVD